MKQYCEARVVDKGVPPSRVAPLRPDAAISTPPYNPKVEVEWEVCDDPELEYKPQEGASPEEVARGLVAYMEERGWSLVAPLEAGGSGGL